VVLARTGDGGKRFHVRRRVVVHCGPPPPQPGLAGSFLAGQVARHRLALHCRYQLPRHLVPVVTFAAITGAPSSAAVDETTRRPQLPFAVQGVKAA
jgi:hypothetical protein